MSHILSINITTAPQFAPKRVTVERLTNTVMLVHWEMLTLEQARGFITQYTVFYEVVGGNKGALPITMNETVLGDDNKVIGELESKLAYLVYVSASTSVGMGNLSDPVLLEVVQDTSDSVNHPVPGTYDFDITYIHAIRLTLLQLLCMEEWQEVLLL